MLKFQVHTHTHTHKVSENGPVFPVVLPPVADHILYSCQQVINELRETHDVHKHH